MASFDDQLLDPSKSPPKRKLVVPPKYTLQAVEPHDIQLGYGEKLTIYLPKGYESKVTESNFVFGDLKTKESRVTFKNSSQPNFPEVNVSKRPQLYIKPEGHAPRYESPEDSMAILAEQLSNQGWKLDIRQSIFKEKLIRGFTKGEFIWQGYRSDMKFISQDGKQGMFQSALTIGEGQSVVSVTVSEKNQDPNFANSSAIFKQIFQSAAGIKLSNAR